MRRRAKIFIENREENKSYKNIFLQLSMEKISFVLDTPLKGQP